MEEFMKTEDCSDDEEVCEIDLAYTLKPWSSGTDELSGYVFRSKDKKFKKAIENIKLKLKKGFSRKINEVKIKVID